MFLFKGFFILINFLVFNKLCREKEPFSIKL